MFKYFISYFYITKTGSGYGNCQVILNGLIEDVDNIREIEENMQKSNTWEMCVVLNYYLLK